jgi:predicted transcriptional regulator
VKRRLKNRAYFYEPVLSRQKAMAQAVGDMLNRFFAGSVDRLVLNLVETRRLTPEKLAQIQRLVEQRIEDEHGNN